MRNTLSLLSRPPQAGPLEHDHSRSPSPDMAAPPFDIPTIRFIGATPSEPNVSLASVAPFASSPLAPKCGDDAPRKRLVPKKSKLSLLGGSKTKNKATQDLSDVARRVSGDVPSTGRGGFEIYVDHAEDPDMSDVVVVKKKKSRLALDGMRWGALGEVTNVPSAPKEQQPQPQECPKAKGDDNQKWWSISRGRKEVKDKGKEKENGSKREKARARSKTPEPSRSRFNSLDAGISLFGVPLQPKPQIDRKGSVSSMAALLTPPEQRRPSIDSASLAPQSSDEQTGSGSIAVRAMRSMRSLARMKSWATIGSTHTILQSDKDKESNEVTTRMTVTTGKTKEKSERKEGEKKEKKGGKHGRKEKKDDAQKERAKTVRLSGSSFEIGAPSPLQPRPPPPVPAPTMKKKQSILGIGVPASMPLSMRLGTRRTSSNASASSHPPVSMLRTRFSPESAHLVLGADGRPASTISSGSSLRPPSSISAASLRSPRSSSGSSAISASVRWDEEGLHHVREMQRRERQSKRESAEAIGSGRGLDARRRVAVMDVFPDLRPSAPQETMAEETDELAKEDATPVQKIKSKIRQRPASDQMVGKARPQGISDDNDEGVLSILDAATNDLASLINRLDLEATPGSVKNTPRLDVPVSRTNSGGSPRRATISFNRDADAPLLSSLRQQSSTSTIKAFAQADKVKDAKGVQSSRKKNTSTAAPSTRQRAMAPTETRKLLGQPIVPWSTLNWQVSPKRPTIRPKASQTVRPAVPAPGPALDPPPVFQPLRPATKGRVSPVESLEAATPLASRMRTAVHPSSQTFGSEQQQHAKVGRPPSMELDDDEPPPPSPSPPPPPKREKRSSRKTSSVLSVMCDSGAILPPEALKSLGLTGTLGARGEPEVDSGEDSDIPDELQYILASQSDDESISAFDDSLSVNRRTPPPTPGLPSVSTPPFSPEDVEEPTTPVLRNTDMDTADNEIDDMSDGDDSLTEDDTNKSFDFTGELRKLNNSGVSDRRSFVEQLENAFRTPARIELGFNISDSLFNKPELTPIPALPLSHRGTPDPDLVPRSVTYPDIQPFDLSLTESVETGAETHAQEESASYQDTSACDTLDHLLAECENDICRPYGSQASVRSKESDGRLNTSFKFGGRSTVAVPEEIPEVPIRPLTLSDIIPPLSHQSSIMEGDSSMMRSSQDDLSSVRSSIVQAHAQEQAPRSRVNSTTSSKRRSRSSVDFSNVNSKRHSRSSIDFTNASTHSRNTSEASFNGFESFEEVRRAFEFGPNRPAFYPPPGATARNWQPQRESMFSIASMSSVGAVVHDGAYDPFGYAPSRPVSDDLTGMSMSVDDTFSFMKRKNPRNRVDSDASSFYFRGAGTSHPKRRSYYSDEANTSVTSNGPPISRYNRGYAAAQWRNDSRESLSPFAQSYAMQGSFAGRAAWARHRRDASVESLMSEFSAARLGRPGVGDKMFDMEYGMPLEAISASPSSEYNEAMSEYDPRGTYDSMFDAEQRTSAGDSLFEAASRRSSFASQTDTDVFRADESLNEHEEAYMRVRQFRPLSMLSIASSHSAPREDDTMISMIGGGHVRRRSVDSGVEGSPCANKERKKTTALQHLARVLRFDQQEDELPTPPSIPAPVPDRMSKASPERVLVQKPSIASTSSQLFDVEPMIKAGTGLLEPEPLEDSSLLDDSEDLLASLQAARLFSRPVPIRRRPRSVASTSGTDTPPLSVCDGSSISSSSQSSIDISHLNALLNSVIHPTSGTVRARARARGAGHRRRLSQQCVSRTSVYETIEEESVVLSNSPSPAKIASPPINVASVEPTEGSEVSVFIVDSESASVDGHWNDEHGIVALRRYFALREEAQETVTESKKQWQDTPFSVFALQAFQPPLNTSAMQEMLEHSKQSFGPLPSELRPHRVRSRTSSRPSPYPLRSRSPPKDSRSAVPGKPFASPDEICLPPAPLQEAPLQLNTSFVPQPLSSAFESQVLGSFNAQREPTKDDKTALGAPRSRVSSGAKRPAQAKRSLGKAGKAAAGKTSASNKENKENAPTSMIIAPSDSLRLSRPRPRGRLNTTQKPMPVA